MDTWQSSGWKELGHRSPSIKGSSWRQGHRSPSWQSRPLPPPPPAQRTALVKLAARRAEVASRPSGQAGSQSKGEAKAAKKGVPTIGNSSHKGRGKGKAWRGMTPRRPLSKLTKSQKKRVRQQAKKARPNGKHRREAAGKRKGKGDGKVMAGEDSAPSPDRHQRDASSSPVPPAMIPPAPLEAEATRPPPAPAAGQELAVAASPMEPAEPAPTNSA